MINEGLTNNNASLHATSVTIYITGVFSLKHRNATYATPVHLPYRVTGDAQARRNNNKFERLISGDIIVTDDTGSPANITVHNTDQGTELIIIEV